MDVFSFTEKVKRKASPFWLKPRTNHPVLNSRAIAPRVPFGGIDASNALLESEVEESLVRKNRLSQFQLSHN
jgi:hypothetical protein